AARARRPRPSGPLEHAECLLFIDWTRLVRFDGEPLFDRVVKIPNERGAAGPAVARLVAIGLRPGFPDYQILAPVGEYHGLFLEAKRLNGSVADEQMQWRDRLLRWGYCASIVEAASGLIGATRHYFAASGERFQDPTSY
ncbi:MAG TPA: hypothetical protein DEH78_05250, partial [Solibacterales bacterium]|nr:hypothetical protein [Bryobacterales bacterium]